MAARKKYLKRIAKPTPSVDEMAYNPTRLTKRERDLEAARRQGYYTGIEQAQAEAERKIKALQESQRQQMLSQKKELLIVTGQMIQANADLTRAVTYIINWKPE